MLRGGTGSNQSCGPGVRSSDIGGYSSRIGAVAEAMSLDSAPTLKFPSHESELGAGDGSPADAETLVLPGSNSDLSRVGEEVPASEPAMGEEVAASAKPATLPPALPERNFQLVDKALS